MIVSILSQKGGVGKTTLSINLARAFVLDNISTLLIDSDAQRSARDWHLRAEGDLLHVIGIDVPTIDKDAPKLEAHYDWIFIDGSPRVDQMAAKTLLISDLTLIPIQPSPYDIWATEKTIDIVLQRIELAQGRFKAAFVINNQKPNTKISKEVREALKIYDIPVLQTNIFNRVNYSESAADGKTVFDGGKNNDSSAVNEITNLKNEIKELVKWA